MAMKKKFLGLALATMVAMPATSAYAAGSTTTTQNSQTITSTNASDSEVSADVDVNGEVLTQANESGKIQVEIPTAMTFAVKADSKIEGPRYEINNLGADSIDVYVSSFTESDGNMTIHTENEISSDSTGGGTATLNRSHVSLILNGNSKGVVKKVDLGKVAKGQLSSETEKQVATITSKTKQTITLTGTAGTKEDTELDKSGTSGNFNLSFKIKKVQP